MKIGRLFNLLAANSELLAHKVKNLGLRVFIKYLRNAYAGALLDANKIKKVASEKQQWRLALIT